MTNLHGIPRIYGMVVIIIGIIFFAPLLAFLTVLIVDLRGENNWSVIMFGLTVSAMIIAILMIGFGTNIVVYHDKKVDDKTIEERAKESKFKPNEVAEDE